MATQSLEIKLKTLTPLWTGGADGTMDRLHETGLIGSLRWWYEAIVRGLGGKACDPTSDDPSHRCHFDNEAYQSALQASQDKAQALLAGLQNVCLVCRLLGCTGWKRRFNLSVKIADNQLSPLWLATLDQPNKFNHWWLSQVFQPDNCKVYFGDLPIQAHFIRGNEGYKDVLKALFSLLAHFGAIGARAQYGFGQFIYLDAYPIEKSLKILRNQITSLTNPKNLSGSFYSLREFWCLQCQIPETNQQIQKFQKAQVVGDAQAFHQHKTRYLPVSFDIRYKLPGSQDDGLRQAYRAVKGKKAARQIFGTVQSEEQKWGSRIFVSHLYKKEDADSEYQLRVWGFTDSTTYEEIQSSLKPIFQNKINITATIGETILNSAESAL